MDLQKLIAEFQAKGGQIQAVPTGARTYTEGDINRLTGPEATTQTGYLFWMRGEDGMEWTERVYANDDRHAELKIKQMFPEARIEGYRVAYA